MQWDELTAAKFLRASDVAASWLLAGAAAALGLLLLVWLT